MRAGRGLSWAVCWVCVACGDAPEPAPPPVDDRTPAAVKLDSFAPGSLDTVPDARLWARQASAPNVYLQANVPAALSLGLQQGSGDVDPTCPVETRRGVTRRLTGGCTDKNGVEWVGVSEEKVGLTGLVTTTYTGFGYLKTVTCEGRTARLKLAYTGTHAVSLLRETQRFETHLVTEAVTVEPETCAETSTFSAMEYEGRVEGVTSSSPDAQSKPTTWNGSGRIGNSVLGTISAVTRDEVTHVQSCATEALSGSTTLGADGHRVVIQYDGATDCADTATVRWSLDGAERGTLSGINCAAANGPTLALWGVLGLLSVMRRRATGSH